jgi:osmotically-inducible protein OsmY
MRQSALWVLCLALALCTLYGCKIFRPPAGRGVPDNAIAAEVRARIADVELLPVRVFVLDGRVTLSGSVPTQEIRQKIIAAAKSVKGVSLVSDDLQLKKIR